MFVTMCAITGERHLPGMRRTTALPVGDRCRAYVFQLARWLAWAAIDALAVRTDCQITTLNPMTEIISPARLVQSPTVIFIGSWTVNLEKGRATFVLFLGDTILGAERDLVAREVPLRPAISQPPISKTGDAAMRPSSLTVGTPKAGSQSPNGT
jgi:hypothetical protein